MNLLSNWVLLSSSPLKNVDGSREVVVLQLKVVQIRSYFEVFVDLLIFSTQEELLFGTWRTSAVMNSIPCCRSFIFLRIVLAISVFPEAVVPAITRIFPFLIKLIFSKYCKNGFNCDPERLNKTRKLRNHTQNAEIIKQIIHQNQRKLSWFRS